MGTEEHLSRIFTSVAHFPISVTSIIGTEGDPYDEDVAAASTAQQQNTTNEEHSNNLLTAERDEVRGLMLGWKRTQAQAQLAAESQNILA